MPRARNIKPAFFLNDELGELDPIDRLLFIGLWTIADYKGELEWRPARIKAQILPYDSCDIKEIVINLDKSGFVSFYSHGGNYYVKINNFEKHQNPHPNEKKKGSEIPKYTDESRKAVDIKGLIINHDKSRQEADESVSNNADSCSLIPDSCNPDSLKGQGSTSQAKHCQRDDVINKIFDYWRSVMGKDSRVKLSQKRKSAINARLNDGFQPAEICEAIKGCSMTPHNMGQNDRNKCFNDIELICRDDNKLTGFIETARAGNRPYSATTANNIQTLNDMEFE